MASKPERYLCPLVGKVIPRIPTFMGRIEMHQWKNPLCACGWKASEPAGNSTHAFASLCPPGAARDNLSKSDQESHTPGAGFRKGAEWNALNEPLGAIYRQT